MNAVKNFKEIYMKVDSGVIILSIMQFIRVKVNLFKCRLQKIADDIMENVYRGGLFWVFIVALVWLAIFCYILFYYYYVPAQSYVRPIHLQLKQCDDNENLEKCPFPSAYVKLTKKHHILVVGQAYKFYVDLDVPESPVNKQLGMFMVCVQLKDANGYLASHSCRSNMLHYTSDVLQTMSLLLLSPLYISGTKEERQLLVFELFSDYEEDQLHQVTDVYIEVQSREVEIYSATLLIEAHLSGLRYMMYNWPITSGILGVSLNVCIILFITALSLYQRYCINAGIDPAKIAEQLGEMKKRLGRVRTTNDDISTDSEEYKENIDSKDEFGLQKFEHEFNMNKENLEYSVE